MIINERPLSPGARIVVRDAEWLVRSVDQVLTGGKQLLCVGIREMKHDKKWKKELIYVIIKSDFVSENFRL
ncbi:hypothetical protein HY745_07790 [Candidatus Desantisbacteria bacterium]|nr:hypothetical protein [Candidatus Desantisbacteria bacterium]